MSAPLTQICSLTGLRMSHDNIQCPIVFQLRIHVLLLLSSSLDGNKFTEGGEAQLRQAADKMKSYPDFVELDVKHFGDLVLPVHVHQLCT